MAILDLISRVHLPSFVKHIHKKIANRFALDLEFKKKIPTHKLLYIQHGISTKMNKSY